MKSLGLLVISTYLTMGNVAFTATPAPRDLFDHEKHATYKTFKTADCSTCHPFKLEAVDRRVQIPASDKNLFVKPLQTLCHTCHEQLVGNEAKASQCSTCHRDVRGIMPKEHFSDWLHQHANTVFKPSSCRSCHVEAFCTECHRKFETQRPKMHSPNFRFIHAIEARTNPSSCSSCHQQSSCQDCHTQGKGLR